MNIKSFLTLYQHFHKNESINYPEICDDSIISKFIESHITDDSAEIPISIIPKELTGDNLGSPIIDDNYKNICNCLVVDKLSHVREGVYQCMNCWGYWYK